jgi:hypothetical protein
VPLGLVPRCEGILDDLLHQFGATEEAVAAHRAELASNTSRDWHDLPTQVQERWEGRWFDEPTLVHLLTLCGWCACACGLHPDDSDLFQHVHLASHPVHSRVLHDHGPAIATALVNVRS